MQLGQCSSFSWGGGVPCAEKRKYVSDWHPPLLKKRFVIASRYHNMVAKDSLFLNEALQLTLTYCISFPWHQGIVFIALA